MRIQHQFYLILTSPLAQATKVSDGAMNPAGGNPVCGSVPLARLNNKICGYGLCN